MYVVTLPNAMSWFRSLIQVSATTTRSSARLRISDQFSYTLLSRFSTKTACSSPTNETLAPAPAPTPTHQLPTFYSGLGRMMPGEKPQVVVLGSGWAGCRLMKGLDSEQYDIVCMSQRNHMVLAPLLASTCVGTFEFRSVAQPIARIQPAISRETGSYFFLSNFGLNPDKHVVKCETVIDGAEHLKPWKFEIAYDKLAIALRARPTTFGIQGVQEHAIFLRDVAHAREIRRKLLLNLICRMCLAGVSEEEKSRLLHCVVVGGGPTGVEFSGELSDFIQRDVQERYAHVKNYIHVTLIEANEILSSFDNRLRHYATKQLMKSGVRLVRGIVKDVKDKKIILNDGTEVPYGLLVWSTGVGPSPLVNSLPLPKSPGGRIGVDEWLHVPEVQDVFAIGDSSGFVESTGKPTLPALAQVAERQGKYLANLLNKIGKPGGGRANAARDYKYKEPFVYKHLGSMATLGRYRALVDLRQSKAGKGISMAGFSNWFIWRGSYITRVISWGNRFYVVTNWLTTLVFGRDTSKI